MDDLPVIGLPVCRVRFTLQAEGGQWPRYKGFLLHGALGATLQRQDAVAFAALYGAQAAGEAGRSWWLRPPLEEAESWLAGSRIDCALYFSGPALRFVPACEAALREMGAAGVGRGAARFSVTSTEIETTTVGEILRMPAAAPVDAVRLTLLTPLRLKQGEALLQTAPTAHVLLQRLFGRLSLLTRQAEVQAGFDWKPWLRLADAVRLADYRLGWVEWPRYSARQQGEMVLGGLRGELRYEGELSELWPWLRLMEWLALGGKTTFGFGQVAVERGGLSGASDAAYST